MSQSFGYTFIELGVVENLRFAVEILIISVILSEISTSGLGCHIAVSGYPSSSKLLSLKSLWSIDSLRFAVEKEQI